MIVLDVDPAEAGRLQVTDGTGRLRFVRARVFHAAVNPAAA
jgi:hypothetical protein